MAKERRDTMSIQGILILGIFGFVIIFSIMNVMSDKKKKKEQELLNENKQSV